MMKELISLLLLFEAGTSAAAGTNASVSECKTEARPVVSVPENLAYTPPSNFVSRNEWQPSCCKRDYYKENTPKCDGIAHGLVSPADPSLEKNIRARLFPNGKRNYLAFWEVFCEFDFNQEGEDNKDGYNGYNKGFITFHDEQLGEFEGTTHKKTTDILITMRTRYSVLLDGKEKIYGELTPLEKDRIDMFAVTFIHKFHNGWSDIGYHYSVGAETFQIFEGRKIIHYGRHAGKEVKLKNGKTFDADWGNIGISFQGNVKRGLPQLSDAHRQAATNLTEFLMAAHSIDKSHIFTHYYIRETDCAAGEVGDYVASRFNPALKTGAKYNSANSDNLLDRLKPLSDRYFKPR